MRTPPHQCRLGSDIAAVIFGVDGVLIDTAPASATAWKAVLDPFLNSHAAVYATNCRSFDPVTDYHRHMRGRTALEGVRSYLTACEIPMCYDAIRGLTARQEELFLTIIRHCGVEAFLSTVTVLHVVRLRGLRTAAVSVCRHAAELLRRAGLTGLFDVRLDGMDARSSSPMSSDGTLLKEAARRMGMPPARTAVVEEKLSALQAARSAGFGLVIGVDRGGLSPTLPDAGAERVITDLADLRIGGTVA
jgi:beta-phosphoglucomutase-like phosphatase (HAD superfamily)